MITRPKVRRVALFIGVAVGAISLLAFVVSVVRPCGTLLSGNARSIILARGSIGVYWQPFMFSGFNAYRNGDPGIATGWWRWLPKWVEPKAPSPQGGFGPIGEFIMPLWIPTAFGLWCAYLLLPERGPRHLCEKCKYDLRAVPAKAGLITCPECGRTSDAPAANPEGTP
jgi:hypothetical protein